MKPLSDDTDPRAHAVVVLGYRAMSLQQKLKRVSELNKAVQQLALARIRRQHPSASSREQQLRLASLWLDAETMRRVFGWDPEREGY